MVAADFDADGDRDLAVSHRATSTVSVLSNNRDGTFEVSYFNVGLGGERLQAADLNGDGAPDLAVIRADVVSILLNDDDGYFGAAIDYPLGVNEPTQAVAIADFDGDGSADLVVSASHTTSAVALLTNQGDGTLASPRVSVHVDDYGYFSDVATADFDGDGAPDFAVVNTQPENVQVFLNAGQALFQEPSTYAVDLPNARRVIAADLNDDGYADLVVGSNSGRHVSVLMNTGRGGRFVEVKKYPVGSSVAGVLAIDLNGDGALDLATGGSGDSNAFPGVTLLLNDGAGGFEGPHRQYLTSGSAGALAAADLNGDGVSDLAVVAFADGEIDYLLNQCDGTLCAPSVAVGEP